jgi:hypothetical protein
MVFVFSFGYYLEMVREIVHIQVGQCGNQIGLNFWNTMRSEHKLEPDGLFSGDESKDAVRTQKNWCVF